MRAHVLALLFLAACERRQIFDEPVEAHFNHLDGGEIVLRHAGETVARWNQDGGCDVVDQGVLRHEDSLLCSAMQSVRPSHGAAPDAGKWQDVAPPDSIAAFNSSWGVIGPPTTILATFYSQGLHGQVAYLHMDGGFFVLGADGVFFKVKEDSKVCPGALDSLREWGGLRRSGSGSRPKGGNSGTTHK